MKVIIEIPEGRYCSNCVFCSLDHCDYHYCAYLDDMPFLEAVDPLGKMKVIKHRNCPAYSEPHPLIRSD